MKLTGLKRFNVKEHLTSREAISAYKEESTRIFNEDLEKFVKEAEAALETKNISYTESKNPGYCVARHYPDSAPIFYETGIKDVFLVKDRDELEVPVFSEGEFESMEEFIIAHGLNWDNFWKDFKGCSFLDVGGNALPLIDPWEESCTGPLTTFSANISSKELGELADYADASGEGANKRVMLHMTQSGIGCSFKVGKPGSDDLKDVTDYDSF
jgi:hypothetical protein